MNQEVKQHEIFAVNSDVGVRVFLSEEPLGFKPLHWHTHIEIVLVLTGEVTFRYEQHDITLHENEFVVIGSGILHATTNLANQALVLRCPSTISINIGKIVSCCDLICGNIIACMTTRIIELSACYSR